MADIPVRTERTMMCKVLPVVEIKASAYVRKVDSFGAVYVRSKYYRNAVSAVGQEVEPLKVLGPQFFFDIFLQQLIVPEMTSLGIPYSQSWQESTTVVVYGVTDRRYVEEFL